MPDEKTFFKKTKVFLDDICSEIAEGDMNFEYIESEKVCSVYAEYIDEHNAKVYVNPGFFGRDRDTLLMLGAARVWQMRHNFPLLKTKPKFEDDNYARKLCSALNEYIHSNHARYIVRSNRMLHSNTYIKNDIKAMQVNIDEILDRLSKEAEPNRFDVALCVVYLCYIYEAADEVKANSIAKNEYVVKSGIAELFTRAIKTIDYHDCSYRYGCIRFFESMLFLLGIEDVFEISFFKT